VFRKVGVITALGLAAVPPTQREVDAAAGRTWAVVVGESPTRRLPLLEALRPVHPEAALTTLSPGPLLVGSRLRWRSW
jgi:hypothetical protein